MIAGMRRGFWIGRLLTERGAHHGQKGQIENRKANPFWIVQLLRRDSRAFMFSY